MAAISDHLAQKAKLRENRLDPGWGFSFFDFSGAIGPYLAQIFTKWLRQLAIEQLQFHVPASTSVVLLRPVQAAQ